ncbi:50S ribosomal protein L11 methyltransferase [bacterium 1XD21-13]|nr:50S ribosomal protein L11 methyltransferase [bacterium 1XD21-13]
MKWNKYTLKTTTEAEDIISNMMMEAGIEGIEIEDKVPLSERDKEQMFVDILPDMPEDDGVAYISFYLEPEMDQEAMLAKVRAGLEEIGTWGISIGEGTITVSETEDKDWINNWKEYFHQFYVDDILIKPSWEETKPEDEDKLLIQIDPGTAFGTGMHETTQLCIRQIRKYLTDETRLLDVGTGSGILSIISLKLGAKEAKGTDLDPCAVDAVRENLEANHIGEGSFELRIGNIIDDPEVQAWAGYECYDIVVANILAEVLVPLTPVVLKHLKPGGIYITSGIIDDKEELVVKTVKDCGFEVLEVTYQGEWVSVTARKPQ